MLSCPLFNADRDAKFFKSCPSSLGHAVFDVEPAVVAGQPLLLHIDAAGLVLALVGAPLGLHIPELLHRQLHPRWLGGGGSGRGGGRRGRGRGGLGRSRMQRAGDEQHGGKTNSSATHFRNSPWIFVELKTERRRAPRDDDVDPADRMMLDQRILAALCSVIQTPHASGMPTKAQN